MKLAKFSYSEYEGNQLEWTVDSFSIGDTNLFVGLNSSGKTRICNVIAGLAKLVTGQIAELFLSGTYRADFVAGDTRMSYELAVSNRTVLRELLKVDDRSILSRDHTGKGTVRAEQIGQELQFQISPNVIAISAKRDAIQHPALEPLFAWGSNLRHYAFGTDLGRSELMNSLHFPQMRVLASDAIDHSKAANVYLAGFDAYGEDFDLAILADLRRLGYDCEQVSLDPLDLGLGVPAMVLSVQESGLACRTTQLTMSQGMFRALALVIHLNYAIFLGQSRTIVIDDIGEGLDFDRSSSFIKVLIERTRAAEIQLIATTNDRFVMNGVPLEYWGVVDRTGSRVRVHNRQSKPHEFESFAYVGLNNFDFFSRKFYERGFE